MLEMVDNGRRYSKQELPSIEIYRNILTGTLYNVIKYALKTILKVTGLIKKKQVNDDEHRWK